ncbi:hypothetical protein P2P98_13100, partial [Microbacterium sp. Kw_RZR3]
MSTPITAFKGFDKDLRCRGFQYTAGQTYKHPGTVDVCRAGFHAVTLPLDVFRYYKPSESVYHRVELEGVVTEAGGDSKVAGKKITVGASLNMFGLVKAHVEAVWNLAKKPEKPSEGSKATTGDYAHA